jgi:hypothetical protein
MFILYLLVFLLDYGNNFRPELLLNPIEGASSACLEPHAPFAYRNHARIVAFVEELLPDLIDDNTSAGNEDDNDGNGKDFPAKNSVQNRPPPDLSDLFIFRNRLISSRSMGAAATPIYLRNRVLRI